MERLLVGLGAVKLSLDSNVDNINQQVFYAPEFNGRALFPQLRTPWLTQEEFDKERAAEERRQSLTEEEMAEESEQLSRELNRKIESGELDIWDDSPQYISRAEGELFFDTALALLKTKMLPALRPGSTLLDDLVLDFLPSLETPKLQRSKFKSLRALMLLWDYARMFYEGEPPFSIKFSDQVAEALGLDAELESAKLQNMRPVEGETRRRLLAAKRVLTTNSSALQNISSGTCIPDLLLSEITMVGPEEE